MNTTLPFRRLGHPTWSMCNTNTNMNGVYLTGLIDVPAAVIEDKIDGL